MIRIGHEARLSVRSPRCADCHIVWNAATQERARRPLCLIVDAISSCVDPFFAGMKSAVLLAAFVQAIAMHRRSSRFRAAARNATATFTCLSMVFVCSPFGSQASAESWLEESGRAEAPDGEKKPDESKWAVTLYGGRLTQDSLPDTLSFSASYADSYVGVAALSWQFYRLGEHIRLEVEGQVAKHFGEQDHWELNAVAIARWVTFPWNAYLATTFAAGEGISYATKIPKLEEKPGASQWLNYLLVEVTFALPTHPEWALVGRIHHRSGYWGALAPNSSNVAAAGIKYRF